MFIYNIYMDPIMEFAEVHLKTDNNTIETFTYNKSEDGDIIVENISIIFNTTPVQLCFEPISYTYAANS